MSEGARRVDGDDAHATLTAAQLSRHGPGQGALARPTGPRHPNAVGTPRVGIEEAERLVALGLAVLDQADDAGQGASLAGQNLLHESLRHFRPSRSPHDGLPSMEEGLPLPELATF